MAASIGTLSSLKCHLNFLAKTHKNAKTRLCLASIHQLNNFRYKSTQVPSNTKTGQKTSSLQYCVDLVKKCDYENYLCTLLYPKSCRPAAFTLRALYIELAQVQDVTTDNMRAIMRLQFWKDSVDQAFKGSPPETPIATLLAKAASQHKLSKLWLTRILEAREKQINTKIIRTLKEIEDTGENTVSALSYLLLEAAGVKNVHADHAASHVGRCQGIVTVLRATPFHASRNQLYLPFELLVKHNVSQEQILRGKEDQAVKDVMYDMASRAHQHLETARSMKKDVPREALPILLNAITCDQYLKNLQLADFNVFDKRLFVRDPKLPWTLLRHRYWKRSY